jgi:hypothetical protein
MKLVDRILRSIGFSRLIKIEGKESFDELTPSEVGLMIDAFLGNGNEFFDPLAFNDFLHAQLRNETLKSIQEELNAKAFIPKSAGKWPRINTEFLSVLSEKLKSNQ